MNFIIIHVIFINIHILYNVIYTPHKCEVEKVSECKRDS